MEYWTYQECGFYANDDTNCLECDCPRPTANPPITYIGKFVNVYLIDRAYGGPEEGGWWYDTGRLIRSTQGVEVSDAGLPTIQSIMDTETAWATEENANRRSDINSVLSEGRYVVKIEDHPGRSWPARRPHYE